MALSISLGCQMKYTCNICAKKTSFKEAAGWPPEGMMDDHILQSFRLECEQRAREDGWLEVKSHLPGREADGWLVVVCKDCHPLWLLDPEGD